MYSVVLAPAKINLFLEVLGKREDGYHEIVSMMQTVSWFDRLAIKSVSGPDMLTVKGEASALVPSDDKNLVLKAARLLRNRTGVKSGVEIILEKSIPPGAGLGGGSSDAAATLKALNDLWETGLAKDELESIAAEIGSDVPFFISGGCALVGGRGEIVRNVPNSSNKFYLVLLVPPIVVSTAAVYKFLQFDLTTPFKPDILDALLGVFRRGQGKSPIVQIPEKIGRNDLMEAAFRVCPELGKIWNCFSKIPFKYKGMSGSGSSFFGICNSGPEAANLANKLSCLKLGLIAAVKELGGSSV